MEAATYTEEKKRRWYNNYQFPIIPQLKTKPADRHNTARFSFSWLFIKIWSLDSFSFEVAFNISEHWGIGFTFLLPYLRIVLCIPFPESLASYIQQKIWRRPKP